MADQSRKAMIFDTTTFESVGVSDEENKDGENTSEEKPKFDAAGISLGVKDAGTETVILETDEDSEKKKDKPSDTSEKKNAKGGSVATVNNGIKSKNKEKDKSRKKAEKLRKLEVMGYPVNEYYLNFSRRYMIAAIITAVLTLIFTFGCLTAFGNIDSDSENNLSIENFKYLFKDIDFSSLTTGSFDSMVYNGGSDALFGVYRGDLVVANAGFTSLYKSSGAFSFTEENEFYSPVLEVSDKYFMVYDMGNTSYGYAVYNSFAELKTDTFDYPITNGKICDEGTYALVTRDENYRSVIKVYDSDLNLTLEVKKEKYTVDIDISDDGEMLYIVSLFDSDGDYSSEISVVNIISGEEKFSAMVESVVPMNIKALDNGNIAVMYTDRITVYTEEGEMVGEAQPSSSTLATGYLSEDLICMTFNNSVVGDEKDILIYDHSFEKLYETTETGELLKITSYDGCIYMLFQDRVLKIDPVNGKEYVASTEANGIDVEFSSNGTAYVCYSGSTLSLDFKETKK